MNRLLIKNLIIKGVTLLTIIIFVNCNGFSREKLYYIPEIDTYIKTIDSPSDNCGYVLFGKNKDIKINDSVDYVKIGRQVSSLFVFEINNENDIYTVENNSVISTNQIDRIFHKSITEKDTTFFYIKPQPNSSPITYIKAPYIGILVSEYSNYASIKESDDYVFKKIKPL